MYEKEAKIIVDALQAQAPGQGSVKSEKSSTFIRCAFDGTAHVVNVMLGSGLRTGIVARSEGRSAAEGGFDYVEDLDEEGARAISSRIIGWLRKQA